MDRPLRYGIIGTGMMGLEHQRNLDALQGAVVTAVADPDDHQLGLAVELSGGSAKGFSDYHDLLDSDLVDAVVIASPNMTHREVAGAAIASGHHVLVEKPLATTVEHCRELEQLAQPGQVIWVGLEYRYMPPVARLVAEVQAGTIGNLKMVGIREHRFPFLPKVGDWNRFNENTGGTLVEKCCHFFDLMRLLVGANPVRVMASGAMDVNHLDERYDGRQPDILDNALVVVDFANGVRASLDLCMFAEGSVNQEELSVVGDLGKLEAFLPSGIFRSGMRSGWAPGVTEEVVVDDSIGFEGFHHGASYLEHRDFLQAITSGTGASVTLEDGAWSVAMGVAAQRSIEEGRVVAVAEVL